jgi:hypothetical protein
MPTSGCKPVGSFPFSGLTPMHQIVGTGPMADRECREIENVVIGFNHCLIGLGNVLILALGYD